MRLIALTALAFGFASTATAQELRIFPIDGAGSVVHWDATSNLGPLNAFNQQYNRRGDLVVRFSNTPAFGPARITDGRFYLPNSVVAALQGGPGPGTVFWRDVEIGVSSPTFNILPTFPSPTFQTTLDLTILSGFVEIDPPFGPSAQIRLAGTQLASVQVQGAFPTVGPAQLLALDSFAFSTPFAHAGWNGRFRHEGALRSIQGCPDMERYCASDPGTPGGGTLLNIVGSSSVTQNNFTFDISHAPTNTFGLIFYGPRREEFAAGFGTVCVGSPWERLVIIGTDAFGNGSFQLDLSQHQMPPLPLAPGTHRNFQFWHRYVDPAQAGWNYSNAVSVVFCP